MGLGAWGGLRATPRATPLALADAAARGRRSAVLWGSRHPQVSSLMKSTVLMRQPRRVQEIVDALRRGGAGSLQVPSWDRVGMVPGGVRGLQHPPGPQLPQACNPPWKLEGTSVRLAAAFPLVW